MNEYGWFLELAGRSITAKKEPVYISVDSAFSNPTVFINVKTSGRYLQIFVAFSEKLNFTY
jgi:hypothetical protein